METFRHPFWRWFCVWTALRVRGGICTDLPCLRMQVMSPATGEAVLQRKSFGTKALFEAIREFAAILPQLKYSVAENAQARLPEQVVDRLSDQLPV